ncbi:hypothetical protein ABZ568_01120 [Streptomyces olindensis]|uniref:vWA-MoxR associated protein C-terminal domain-containing protein n=1 Tax=Streptomyces olindensis TaxID=358823 RepID=A0ABV2XM78_9ACTN
MSHRADDLSDVAAERTYALVVGVESYEVDDGWRLPGAAHDAQRFAAWLTGSGRVPPANLRLLLSPLPDTDLSRGRDLPKHQPATEQHVKQALFHDLPSRDGDLLWIYWAGHGFHDDGHLLLPYADATGPHTVHLNLEAALRWWGSTDVDRRRFRHQIVMTDACRVDRRRSPRLNFWSVDYGGGELTEGRGQFVLYAARPGEAARNEEERRAGLFTDKLLDALNGMTVGQGVRALTDVTRGLQADFDVLCAQQKAWQRPSYLIRGWDGSAVYGGDWTDSSGTAPLLDQQAWNDLAALTRGRDLPPCVHDAYRWAFQVCGCAAPPQDATPAGSLTEFVRDLDDRQGRPGKPLTLPFVRYLAAHTEDREWGARLDDWVDRTRERIGARPVAAAPERPPEPAHVHVQLAEAAEKDRYFVRVWLYQGTFSFEWESSDAVALSDARSELGERIGAVAAKDSARGTGRIEFHIPVELLDEEFEAWSMPFGPGRLPQEVGQFYEVVVRCPDARDGSTAKWREKWRSFEAHGEGQWESPTIDACHPIWLITEDEMPPNLAAFLRFADFPVGVLVQVGRERLPEALSAVVASGVPIALWHRSGPPKGPAGTGDLATALASPGGRSLDLRKLPRTLLKLRILAGASATEQGRRHPLALLWDDPNRRPRLQRLEVNPPHRTSPRTEAQ